MFLRKIWEISERSCKKKLYRGKLSIYWIHQNLIFSVWETLKRKKKLLTKVVNLKVRKKIVGISLKWKRNFEKEKKRTKNTLNFEYCEREKQSELNWVTSVWKSNER